MACVYTKQFSKPSITDFLSKKGWKPSEDDPISWISPNGKSVISIGSDGIPGCLSNDIEADCVLDEWTKLSKKSTKQFSAWDEGVFEEKLEDLIYEYSQEDKGVDIKTMIKILKYYTIGDNLTSYIEGRREKENG